MSLAASEIADTYEAAITNGLLLEKTVYYGLQRDCLEAAKVADVRETAVFFAVAQVAEALASALEDDAIEAENLLLWKRYALEIVKALRLACSDLSIDEVAHALIQFVSIALPPRTTIWSC